jgi:hypothetical protein
MTEPRARAPRRAFLAAIVGIGILAAVSEAESASSSSIPRSRAKARRGSPSAGALRRSSLRGGVLEAPVRVRDGGGRAEVQRPDAHGDPRPRGRPPRPPAGPPPRRRLRGLRHAAEPCFEGSSNGARSRIASRSSTSRSRVRASTRSSCVSASRSTPGRTSTRSSRSASPRTTASAAARSGSRRSPSPGSRSRGTVSSSSCPTRPRRRLRPAPSDRDPELPRTAALGPVERKRRAARGRGADRRAAPREPARGARGPRARAFPPRLRRKEGSGWADALLESTAARLGLPLVRTGPYLRAAAERRSSFRPRTVRRSLHRARESRRVRGAPARDRGTVRNGGHRARGRGPSRGRAGAALEDREPVLGCVAWSAGSAAPALVRCARTPTRRSTRANAAST